LNVIEFSGSNKNDKNKNVSDIKLQSENIWGYSSHQCYSTGMKPSPVMDSAIKFSGIPGASTIGMTGTHLGEFEPRFLE